MNRLESRPSPDMEFARAQADQNNHSNSPQVSCKVAISISECICWKVLPCLSTFGLLQQKCLQVGAL